jgi:hypothetical protein
MKNTDSCATCKHLGRPSEEDEKRHRQMAMAPIRPHCRRYAPRDRGWPLVDYADVCGEYEKKPCSACGFHVCEAEGDVFCKQRQECWPNGPV